MMGAILAAFAGKSILGWAASALLGTSGIGAVAGMFGLFRNMSPLIKRLIFISIAVVAVLAMFLIGLTVHAHKVHTFGEEQRAIGRLEVQARWDKAVADAERAAADAQHRAAEALSMQDLQQMQDEDHDDQRFQSLNDELARAMAADPDPFSLSINGELLRSRRNLNPSSH